MYIWIDSCINFFNDDILIKFIAVIQLDVSLFTRSLSGAAVVSLKLLYHNFAYCPQSFERRPHKMLKDTQTIRRQFGSELFECVWPFCGVGP